MKTKIIVITFSIFYSYRLFCQDNPILADSILEQIFIADSIEYKELNDSLNSTTAIFLDNRGKEGCRIVNKETFNSTYLIYDLGIPYIQVLNDQFNTMNNNYWNIVNNCDGECWTLPDDEYNKCKDDDNNSKVIGDNGITYYVKENVSILERTGNNILTLKVDRLGSKQLLHNGSLNIDAYYEFKSGFVHSKKAYNMSFGGMIEARIKLPPNIDDAGLWPAFWLMSNAGLWNEIDIFEFFDKDRQMTTTLIENPGELGYNGHRLCQTRTARAFGFFNDWHKYKVVWNNAFIAVLIDDKLIASWSHYLKNKKRGEFKDFIISSGEEAYRRLIYPTNPMRIMFNLATYPCNASRKTGFDYFPQTLEMDWIKVWKQAPCDEDIEISTKSQIPEDPYVYNMLFGKNVLISCDYIVPTSGDLQIYHSGILTDYKTIEAGQNAVFEIKPTSSCNLVSKKYDSPGFIGKSINSSIENSSDIINISPNPVKNEFKINTGFNNTYRIEIKNSMGKSFFNEFVNNSSERNINIQNFPVGIYFVDIFDTNNKLLKTSKICKIEE